MQRSLVVCSAVSTVGVPTVPGEEPRDGVVREQVSRPRLPQR